MKWEMVVQIHRRKLDSRARLGSGQGMAVHCLFVTHSPFP